MRLSVRVFDTILDDRNLRDTVTRNSADFWKTFCKSSGWDFSYERVHSLEDLNHFFKKKIKENVLIFSGHGSNGSGWRLSNGVCFNGSNPGVYFPEKNFEKYVIFSSCLIGKNEELSLQMKDFFGAKNLFAYRHVIDDRFCFLNESILLTLIEKSMSSNRASYTSNDFIDFQMNTDFMKNLNQKHVKNHPMRMF